MIILTKATSVQYANLLQLLISLETYEPDLFVIICDFDLEIRQRQFLEHYFSQYETFKRDSEKIPSIVKNIIHDMNADVLWLDPTCICIKRLKHIERIIEQQKIYCPLECGYISDKLFKSTSEFFNIDKNLLSQPLKVPKILGINKKLWNLIDKWDKSCNILGYEQKDVIISILIYQNNLNFKNNLLGIDIS